MRTETLWRLLAVAFLLLLCNSAYLAALPAPTLFFMGNVLAHVVLGAAVAVGGALWLRRQWRLLDQPERVGAVLFAATILTGCVLVAVGNTTPNRWIFWTHVAAACLLVAVLLPASLRLGRQVAGWRRLTQAFVAAVAAGVALVAVAALWHHTHVAASARIRNPSVVPVNMNEEGGGPRSPFFPSSAKTNVGGIIPANFFLDSAACGECHKDIYQQWQSSAHHFASFNNQFYRKSIEYMQDVVGPQPSKWCAGCHDHAVFFNGRFDRPIREQIDTVEAHAGLACTSCHAIAHVEGSMGNGGFTMEYPALHELAVSKNPVLHRTSHLLTYLDPGPHKQTFMKPFMRLDNAEFCASCHKVHLDVPVNSYRWFRGFNDYDNWQASGVSGQGARSFYYPKQSKTCGGCHMPLVASDDPGNHEGMVHSHRFPGANTALPFVNHDAAQLTAVEKFLKSGFITVDIFAASPEDGRPAGAVMVRRSDDPPQAMTGFAVGEEAEQAGPAFLRDVGRVAAPLDQAAAGVRPGQTVKVDVVVRTRTIGHFFPGGTIDAFDTWLELQARDAGGKVVFWSGMVEDGGKGPVEPGAHFYRTVQLDAAGNLINKRNAWQSRTVLYTRLIPPGAADVVHYRIQVPPGTRGPLSLTARLNYRKFSRYYTRFAYAGKPLPGQDARLLAADHNSLDYSYDAANIPTNVSGEVHGQIPDLPIVVLATAEAKLAVADGTRPGDGGWQPVVRKADGERWNDWGIGLLLQGDLKGAEYAFRRTTEATPGYADGWLNEARTLIREGELTAARPLVAKALALSPGLPRALFFRATIEKQEGDYEAALASLRAVERAYPRDRVVLNQIARILFLERRYAEALPVLDRVCLIDPEDVQLHYTAMLCHRALGHREQAAREAALFRRFKADESAQALTADRRQLSPEDNNERQPIHEHASVPLTAVAAKAGGGAQTVAAIGGDAGHRGAPVTAGRSATAGVAGPAAPRRAPASAAPHEPDTPTAPAGAPAPVPVVPAAAGPAPGRAPRALAGKLAGGRS